MIIRMTVNDNGFDVVMGSFCAEFFFNLVFAPYPSDEERKKLPKDEDYKSLCDWDEHHKRISAIMNKTKTEDLSKEEKAYIAERTKLAFAGFLDKHQGYCPDETRNYLKEHFSAKIVGSVKDKDENHKAYYWFQSSDQYINQ